MTPNPVRSHVAIILKSAWSMILPDRPSRRAALSMFAPVVPLTGLVRHAFATCCSDAAIPKHAATMHRHAGPHMASLCWKLFVSNRIADEGRCPQFRAAVLECALMPFAVIAARA